MTRISCGILAVALSVAAALAGPEQIIKERAKELRNQNNVRQGVTPPSAPATSAPAAAPGVAAPSQQNMSAVQNDLASIQTGMQITPQHKQKLARDLIAAAQTSNKPSEPTTLKFAGDLLAAYSTKALPASSRTRLISELDAILNPGKYPQAKLDAIYADIQAIFQANGLKRAEAVTLSDDLKILSAEVQVK